MCVLGCWGHGMASQSLAAFSDIALAWLPASDWPLRTVGVAVQTSFQLNCLPCRLRCSCWTCSWGPAPTGRCRRWQMPSRQPAWQQTSLCASPGQPSCAAGMKVGPSVAASAAKLCMLPHLGSDALAQPQTLVTAQTQRFPTASCHLMLGCIFQAISNPPLDGRHHISKPLTA